MDKHGEVRTIPWALIWVVQWNVYVTVHSPYKQLQVYFVLMLLATGGRVRPKAEPTCLLWLWLNVFVLNLVL